ncbi:MAG: hypothetical protein V1874_09415 [Spirochaetota bacterium]
MHFENIMLGLAFSHISAVKLPEEHHSDITVFLKNNASCVVDHKVKDRKSLFMLLNEYSKANDIIIFFNNDHLLKKRTNSQYTPILNHISNYEFMEPVKFEIKNTVWDPDYDQYKIAGFNQYNGRMIFVTDLNENEINERLIQKHCYFNPQVITELGNIE